MPCREDTQENGLPTNWTLFYLAGLNINPELDISELYLQGCGLSGGLRDLKVLNIFI